MKKYIGILITMILLTGLCMNMATAQESETLMRIEKHDGTEFVGVILEDNEREVLIEVEDLGKLYIPKHTIKSMSFVSKEQFQNGKYIGEERFATRYFITTNGLPIKKGEHYAMFSWYGPEIHFAASDHLSVGAMSSWLGAPLIGSVKYSFKLADGVHAGVGVLAGTLGWFNIRANGALGYGALTLGNRNVNLTFSGGYAHINPGDGYGGSGAPLLSVSGMAKVSRRFAIVADSFIYPGEKESGSFALIMPGFRYSGNKNAFQVGFGGVAAGGEVLPVPIPVVSWMRAIK